MAPISRRNTQIATFSVVRCAGAVRQLPPATTMLPISSGQKMATSKRNSVSHINVSEKGSVRILPSLCLFQIAVTEGRATVRFSARADIEPLWQDVRAGIVRNVSVGNVVRAYEVT